MLRNKVLFDKSKIDNSFYNSLEKWVKRRNGYIHGLYKSEIKYKSRLHDKKFAEDGLLMCRKLYNETNRLKSLRKRNADLFQNLDICSESDCALCEK